MYGASNDFIDASTLVSASTSVFDRQLELLQEFMKRPSLLNFTNVSLV